jgi:hypothetical protein
MWDSGHSNGNNDNVIVGQTIRGDNDTLTRRRVP